MAQYSGDVNASTFMQNDWGAEGAQWSGEQVQKGIKESFDHKSGCIKMYKKYICMFKDEESYNTWVSLGSNLADKIYLLGYTKINYNDLISKATIKVSGIFSGKNIGELAEDETLTVTKDNCKLTNLSFNCTYEVDDEQGIRTEAVESSVSIDWYIKVDGQIVRAGVTKNNAVIDDIDLSEFVSSTKKEFQIYVKFDTTQTGEVEVRSAILPIQLNDYALSFADEYFWKNRWVKTEDQQLNLWLLGSTDNNSVKTVVEFYDKNIRRLIVSNQDLTPSSKSYSTFVIPNNDLNNLSSGVYNIRVHFEYNNTSSPIITKNILVIQSESDSTPFICANLESDTFTNFTSIPICQYIVNGPISKVAQSIGNLSVQQQVNNFNSFTFSALLNIDSEEDMISTKVTLADVENLGTPYFSETVQINNKNRFNSTSGAIVEIDPSGQTNELSYIFNSAKNEQIEVEWNDMTWGDNNGWTQDDQSINILKILKESSVTIKTPLLQSTASGSDFTFEIMYKIENATTEEDVVIKGITESGNQYCGLKIYPSKIDYRPFSGPENLDRTLQISSDELIHLSIVYYSNYSNWGSNEYLGTKIFPLTKIYINGKIAREIYGEFTPNNANLLIGGQDSDISIYKIRKYNSALSDANVLKNFLNCYNSDLEKRIEINTKNSIYTDQIDFTKIKDKYNCFVLSSESYPDDIQSFTKKEADTKCVLPGFTNNVSVDDALIELYWDKENFPGNDNVKIQIKGENGKLQYQGSSSRDYYRWNWRSKFASACDITHEDGSVKENGTFIIYPTYRLNSDGTKVPTNGIECSVLTAKKNYASSMQSHKMGAVNSYNDLYNQMSKHSAETVDNLTLNYDTLLSPIMANNSSESTSNKRNATWQAPFFGFIKTNDQYRFIGLYTIGPDKGDKKITGFDTKVYRRLVEFEGANQDPRFTNFMLPWDEETISINTKDLFISNVDNTLDTTGAWELIKFNPECYLGELIGTLENGDDINKFDGVIEGSTFVVADDYNGSDYIAGRYYTLDSEGTWAESKYIEFEESNHDHMMWQLRRDFKPTYKFVFDHNINLNVLKGTLDTSLIPTDNIYCLYWLEQDPERKIYYYNSKNSAWEAAYYKWYDESGELHSEQCTIYDGFDQLFNEQELSADELNEKFIAARAEHFKNNCSKYFNLLDTLIWFINVEIYAGTDERAKNIYPYKLGSVKYKKQKDDSGKDIYVFDKIIGENTWRWRLDDADTRFDIDNEGRATKKYYIESGDSGDNGSWPERSALFNLLNHEVFYNLRKNVFTNTLNAMCELVKENSSIISIQKFHQKYFWDWSADYFTEMGYNEDAIFSYDQAKACQIAGLGLKVDPITQSYGDHKLAEQKFITERIKYLSSKYVYVPVLTTDVLDFGRGTSGEITIKYDGWVYPTWYTNGNNNNDLKSSGIRLEKGGSYIISAEGGQSSSTAIGSKSLINDISANWSEVKNPGVEISFDNLPKLKDLNLSGFEGKFKISNNVNLQTLNINGCTNIETGNFDISSSTHLKELDARNTNLLSIKPASGAPLTRLQLPSAIEELYLDKLQKLTLGGLNLTSWNGLKNIFIRDCHNSINPLQSIFNVVRSGNSNFEHIYISGLNETWSESDAPRNLESLIEFANYDLKGYTEGTDGQYVISNNTQATLSGELTVNCDYFLNDINKIQNNFKGSLKINTPSQYYGLIIFNNKKFQNILHRFLSDNIYTDTNKSDLSIQSSNERYNDYIIASSLSANYPTHTSRTTVTDILCTPGNDIISEANPSNFGTSPDFSDWGTWFPDRIPGFIMGHTLSDVKLNLKYTTKTADLNLSRLTSGNQSNTTNNYSQLVIDGPSTQFNNVKIYGSSSSDNGKTPGILAVDSFNINAQSFNIYSMSEGKFRIKNLYFNSPNKFGVQSSFVSVVLPTKYIENFYINQDAYWNYIEDSILSRRITSYDSNYIPWDFLNNRLGNVPENKIYDIKESHMILSKTYFKINENIQGNYLAPGTSLNIRFVLFADGSNNTIYSNSTSTWILGNNNFSIGVSPENKLLVSIVGKDISGQITENITKSECSNKSLTKGKIYDVKVYTDTQKTEITILENGSEFDFYTIGIKDHWRRETPYAIGTKNSSSYGTNADDPDYSERWNPENSNFVGAIMKIEMISARGGVLNTIYPQINQNVSTFQSSIGSTVSLDNDGIYKAIIK